MSKALLCASACYSVLVGGAIKPEANLRPWPVSVAVVGSSAQAHKGV